MYTFIFFNVCQVNHVKGPAAASSSLSLVSNARVANATLGQSPQKLKYR
jgi:hypothetical protein